MKCTLEYITHTTPLRGGETQRLISFVRPHKAVSKDAIGRWIKSVFANAGIDTSHFGAHSTRAASTSAKNCGLDMATIMKAAGGKLQAWQIRVLVVFRSVTNSHVQLLCNILFVQLELDLNLIFRFLCYDRITCIYFTICVIVRSSDTFLTDQ